MNKDYSGSTGMKLAVVIIAAVLFSSSLLMLSDNDSEAAIDKGTLESPLESLDCGSFDLFGTFYIKVGSTVKVTKEYNAGFAGWRYVSSVTSDYGLSIADNPENASVGSETLSGSITKAGTIYVETKIKKNPSGTVVDSTTVIIYAVSDGVSIDSISISGPTSVKMGETIDLVASITPLDATNKDLSWSVSDKSVAVGYVNDDPTTFTLIGLSAGTVTVTAESTDGSDISSTYEVTVKESSIETTTLYVKDCAGSNSAIAIDPNKRLVYFKSTYESYGVDYSLYNAPKGLVQIDTDTAVMIVPAGETILGWTSYSDYTSTREYGTFTISVTYTITFDANGGKFEDGSTTKVMNAIDPIALPAVYHDTSTFTGWYTGLNSTDTYIGGIGSEYIPSSNITLFAHWGSPGLVASSEFQWSGTEGGILNYTPNVRDSVTGQSVTGFKVLVKSDETNCLQADGSSIIGLMSNLIPGEYSALISISKTGYESTEQTIIVTIPVTALEPISDSVIVGEEWSTTLVLKPDDAYIKSYSIKLGDSATTSFTARKSGNSFYITCKSEGLYTISLELCATGINPSIKTIKLNATAPEQHEDPPTISSIRVTKDTNPLNPNTWYFTAVGVANYDTITWNFGDGLTGSGIEVIHQFKMGVYDVTCTVKNVTTGESASKTYSSLEALDKSLIDASDVINIGSPYSPDGITNSSQMVLSVKMNNNDVTSLFTATNEAYSQGYILKITGTITDLSYVGKTLSFEVKSGSTVVKTWTATVYPAASSEDVGTKPSFQANPNGMDVSLSNITPNGAYIRLLIDWGDGKISSGAANGSFSHTYSESGAYQLSALWTWTDSSGISHEGESTVSITVGSSTPGGITISYDPNGGQGKMDDQKGTPPFVLPGSSFSWTGHTFVCWCTSSDILKGTIYKPGSEINPDKSLTLYAIWSDDEKGGEGNNTIQYVVITVLIVSILFIFVRRWI